MQSAEDVPDSIEHWALKVLLLVLGMLVPGPETNLTPMHWGSYCNHKFGYTTVAEAKVDLQRSTKRESEERAFMDAAAKSQTHVRMVPVSIIAACGVCGIDFLRIAFWSTVDSERSSIDVH